MLAQEDLDSFAEESGLLMEPPGGSKKAESEDMGLAAELHVRQERSVRFPIAGPPIRRQ